MKNLNLSLTVKALNDMNAIAKSYLTEVTPALKMLLENGCKVFNANKTFSAKWLKDVKQIDEAAFEVFGNFLMLHVKIEIEGETFSTKFKIGKIHKSSGLLLLVYTLSESTFDSISEDELLAMLTQVKEIKSTYEEALEALPMCARKFLK